MKIFRISNLLSLSLATLFGFLLFWTSQAVHKKEEVLHDLQKNLEHEKEASRVLSLEWDYLNRPQRLEKLASEQLGMTLPNSGGVVKTIEEIPEPVLASNNSEAFDEDAPRAIEVSEKSIAPTKVIVPETIAPSKTEKQSFDNLIQSLDKSNGDVQ